MLVSTFEKRRKIHHKVLEKITSHVALVSSFVLIFSIIFVLMNWPAYSKIFQGWINADVLKSREVINGDAAHSSSTEAPSPEISLPKGIASHSREPGFSDLGTLYPNEMRLEVPKVFDGTIPIQMVDVKNFQLKDLYASSENEIQKALRDGVVHYPYTANPNQFGNVFITGHSSYYPWAKGNYKDIFATLERLSLGDRYFIYFQGKRYTYQVYEIFEVQPDDVSVLEQPLDKKISTLMTCTPVGTTLRRLIVRAELVNVS